MASVNGFKKVSRHIARQAKRLLTSNRRGATLRIDELLRPFIKSGSNIGRKIKTKNRREATQRRSCGRI